MKHSPVNIFVRRSLYSAILAAGGSALLPVSTVLAADSTAPAASKIEEIVVPGFRLSLQQSADAKHDSVGFTDSIFAQDMGKFPDSNIAESVNRIPGITITRDYNGAGVNIAIRGLGTDFTRVLMNNNPIAVASTGRTGAQGVNREVDLSIFPTELFTQITVNKSPVASMLEGGAAGTVNLRSARPFDKEGFNARYSLEGMDNSNASDTGTHGSFMVSNTWGDFGVLVGASIARDKVAIKGWESVGWTNPNLSAAQCATGCNSTGGGNWTIPPNVPANAGNGLNAGDVIDQAFLLAKNPGTTIQQIDNGLIPRLGRPVDDRGSAGRDNAIVSLEYRPSDKMHFYLDTMYGKRTEDLRRIDINWVGRNGAMVPLNTKVDRSDCSAGCVVTQATYANAQFFLEYRPWIEETKYWGVNPGMQWELADNIKLDVQANTSRSDHVRETPTVLPITLGSSGITVNYSNNGGLPTISSNVDLNNPANFVWAGGRVNEQDETRETKTDGARFDLTWGDEKLNVKVGASTDKVSRQIRAFDNSQAWQNATCGNNPNIYLPGPNSQPPCNGLSQSGAAPAGYPTYPGLGTGYTTGNNTVLSYGGSLVPTSALAGYLTPGPAGFVTLDWDKFKAATKYDSFHANTLEGGSSNSGANAGYIEETVDGLYAELNGIVDLMGNSVRYNAGMRRASTDQTIGGRLSITDPRNAATPAPADGGRYPNITKWVYTNTSYNNWLPSFSVAYDVSPNAVFRAALSKTMTRPNPNNMLPGLNFSSPSADTGSVGNAGLTPYLSKNIDIGFDLYTGGPGYVSITAFRKAMTGFTVNGNNTVPFASLAAYGVTYDTLNPTQQGAITARGGPTSAQVTLTQQVNSPGKLVVNGLEMGWVQPLDFLLERFGMKGLGFSANTTFIDQYGSGAAPAIALGVAPRTTNYTFWYENYGVSARVSYTFARGSQSANGGQNGITAAALYGDDYAQWDLSSSYDLTRIFNLETKYAPELTLNVVNLKNEKQRSYFQFSNATNDYYEPGRTVMFGLRGKF